MAIRKSGVRKCQVRLACQTLSYTVMESLLHLAVPLINSDHTGDIVTTVDSGHPLGRQGWSKVGNGCSPFSQP